MVMKELVGFFKNLKGDHIKKSGEDKKVDSPVAQKSDSIIAFDCCDIETM